MAIKNPNTAKKAPKTSYLEITASDFYFNQIRPFIQDIFKKVKTDQELIRSLNKTINAVDSFIIRGEWQSIIEEFTMISQVINDKNYFITEMNKATETEKTLVRTLSTKIDEFLMIVKYEKPVEQEEQKPRERINFRPPTDKMPNGENKDYDTHNMKILTAPINKERIPNV